jgi:hypothetical protein
VTRRLSWFADEGMTTVQSDGVTRLVYRGGWSIPPRLRVGREWVHIGDPGSHADYLFDCYQGPDGAVSKMFEVQTPDGGYQDYVHPLTTGELLNNSFAAVSPDGQWMLSGEWFDMTRLLVFPTPVLNPAGGTPGATLPLSAVLTLDHQVRNVQGATFVTPTTLLCSTDDPGTDLWPSARQLLQLDLPRPMDGTAMTAAVSYLGPVPLESRCTGTFEVEGIDYDGGTGDLRIAVIPPGLCKVWTSIYRFRRA